MKLIAKRPFHVWISCVVLLAFSLAKLGTIAARRMGLLPRLLQAQLADDKIMLYAGIAELVAVILILSFLSTKRACQLIALIGTAFLTYRYFMFNVPCPCMGAAPTMIPWLRLNERIILLTVPIGFLLIGLWGSARETDLSSTKSPA